MTTNVKSDLGLDPGAEKKKMLQRQLLEKSKYELYIIQYFILNFLNLITALWLYQGVCTCVCRGRAQVAKWSQLVNLGEGYTFVLCIITTFL